MGQNYVPIVALATLADTANSRALSPELASDLPVLIRGANAGRLTALVRRPHGGTSPANGALEIMLHRR